MTSWCYKTDCVNNEPGGTDKDGRFGFCNCREIIIDKDGKCKNEENI